MGVTAPGVFKEKRRRDVPLAGESVATCLFKTVGGQSAAGPTKANKTMESESIDSLDGAAR